MVYVQNGHQRAATCAHHSDPGSGSQRQEICLRQTFRGRTILGRIPVSITAQKRFIPSPPPMALRHSSSSCSTPRPSRSRRSPARQRSTADPTAPTTQVQHRDPRTPAQRASGRRGAWSVSVVVGAFTDAAGNVMPLGVAPLYVTSVIDVGGSIGAANSGSLRGATVPDRHQLRRQHLLIELGFVHHRRNRNDRRVAESNGDPGDDDRLLLR